jgi:hypothetical protein
MTHSSRIDCCRHQSLEGKLAVEEDTMAEKSKRGLSPSKSRSSGMKGGSRSAKPPGTTASDRAPGPKLPGEKSVRETRKSVAVKPLKVSREAESPLDARAIDRRKQVFDHEARKR